MATYVQLNPDNSFSRKISGGEPIVWDENNYCTAEALVKDGKSAEFRVHPFKLSEPPIYDPQVQASVEGTPAYVGDSWTQVWEIMDLDAATISANQQLARQELQASIVSQTQARLDAFAKTRNYAGILSLCTYSGSLVPKFAAEGQYGIQLRDDTWSTCYQILADVEAGTRPLPSGYEEIAPELPTPQWPA